MGPNTYNQGYNKETGSLWKWIIFNSNIANNKHKNKWFKTLDDVALRSLSTNCLENRYNVHESSKIDMKGNNFQNGYIEMRYGWDKPFQGPTYVAGF